MRTNPRIALAFVVGLAMVGGSYMLSRASKAESLNDELVVVTKKPVREFIPVSDTNKDGEPDWQDSLAINTVNLNGENSGTKTGELAIELATLASATGSDPDQIFSAVGDELLKVSVDEEFTKTDINISYDNSEAALRSYGNNIAAIALDNAPPKGTEDELTILNRALVRKDPNVLKSLSPTITSYERMIEAMLETPVPSSMVREHLSLLNVYQAILNNIKSFQGVFSDALPAMMRFRRYQADVEALYVALNLVYITLRDRGIEWGPNDRASDFITIESI